MDRTSTVPLLMLCWQLEESRLHLCILMQHKVGWLTLGLIPPMFTARHILLLRAAAGAAVLMEAAAALEVFY
jgi:hypothetical protein